MAVRSSPPINADSVASASMARLIRDGADRTPLCDELMCSGGPSREELRGVVLPQTWGAAADRNADAMIRTRHARLVSVSGSATTTLALPLPEDCAYAPN